MSAAFRARLTLGRVFALGLLGLALALGALFYRIFEGSRQTIVRSSEPLREEKSSRIGKEVEDYLGEAERSIGNIERQIQFGSCHADDALSVESHLFAEILNNPHLAEVAFTRGTKVGYDENLEIEVAPKGRWQVSVFRETPDPGSPIRSRFTYVDGGRFVAEARKRPPAGGLLDAPLARLAEADIPDPTEHPTFKTTGASWNVGKLVWSDLSHTELDVHLPEDERRVVVTVMKVVENREGRFVGVVRVGILARQIDEMVQKRQADDPHFRVFLCDDQARLITRLAPDDHLGEEADTSLRIHPPKAPPDIAMALEHPALQEVREGHLKAAGRFTVEGRGFLVSFRGLPATQGWRVGMVVAEDDLPGIAKLKETRAALLKASLAVIGLILAGGIATLRVVQRGLARIVWATDRIRSFEFAPCDIRSPFRDVHAVMESVELAKTAMRAMGKYVPIDLVRLLYQTRREPVLGGELMEVSLMFTDIKDFTSLSESVAPNELAQLLGRYLEVMTKAIHGTQGVIDKYIGDAVMAVWNAPTACPDHAKRACQAALACVRATRELYESPEWAGRPPLVTRIGLHRDRVMVGHFGAPDRMSFTALGDGVNLASRLEGLNKQYSTSVLASEAIYEQARGEFVFRCLDIVAVKGKTKGVRVYELVAEAGKSDLPLEVARRYETAFEAYLRRDFAGAAAILRDQDHDGPSKVLHERCLRMQTDPPPADWDGIYVSKAK